MKTILTLLLALNLASCTSDGKIDKAKAAAVTNIALDYAVKSGKVTPSDAALVREVGTIVLNQGDAPAAPVTATK